MKQILLFHLKQLNSNLDQLHINQFANYTYSIFCISDKEDKIVLVFWSSKLLMIKCIDWLKTKFFS